jgi:hypothetical protein
MAATEDSSAHAPLLEPSAGGADEERCVSAAGADGDATQPHGQRRGATWLAIAVILTTDMVGGLMGGRAPARGAATGCLVPIDGLPTGKAVRLMGSRSRARHAGAGPGKRAPNRSPAGLAGRLLPAPRPRRQARGLSHGATASPTRPQLPPSNAARAKVGIGTLGLPADFARLGWLPALAAMALFVAGGVYSGSVYQRLSIKVPNAVVFDEIGFAGGPRGAALGWAGRGTRGPRA